MSSSASPVFVSEDAARAVFQWKDAVAALQAAYGQALPPASTPPRSIGASQGGWLRTLPAVPPGGRYFGAKLMGGQMTSPNKGVEYVIVLFERENSRIAGFVDGNLVTGYRTASTSAAALDKLVPENVNSLGVIGSCLEASMHTRAFSAVRNFSGGIKVFSPTPASRERFASTLADELGVPVQAVATPEEAAGDSDVVLTAARSRGEVPILFSDWLKPTAAVVSIGSTVPEQREIDVSVVQRADLIVCDTLEEVREETGDMIEAHKAGIDVHSKTFALTDLLNGSLADRVKTAKTPMFKSVGAGIQDIVVAELILIKALEAGLATSLPMTFAHKTL
jgi:alanine dehydrogenase